MPLITHTAVCTFKALIARGVYELRFTKPAGFTFKPGQFILFNVPLVDHPHDMQTRAFSIASAPAEDDLLFVAKMIPGGRASRWIDEVLGEGVSVSFTGAFGNFVLDTVTDKHPLFVATGTGIAPFRSMMRGAMGERKRIDLIFGVKSEEDLFWTEWLSELTQRHPHVFVHVTLSAPSPSWTGRRGRVQTIIPGVVRNDFSRVSLYACGSPQMCTEVKALALGEWGMGRRDVHVEGYI